MIKFTELVRDARVLGPSGFLASHRVPVLYVKDLGRLEEDAGAFETRFDFGARRDAAPPRRPLESSISVDHVLPLSKRRGAPFPDRIGVGRAPNADVRIPLPRMSKYHAFFTIEADGEHTLTDAGSSYGTSVRGSRLVPRRATVLRDGDEIRFAEYAFVFYRPAALLAVVHELRTNAG